MRRLSICSLLLVVACSTPGTEPVDGPEPRLPRPDLPSDRPLQVGFLVIEGVYNTELTAPLDLFHHTVFHTKPGMEVFTVGRSTEPIRTFEQLAITPDYDLESHPDIDVLVVPSAEHNMDTDLEDAALIEWVRRVGSRARYVISLCDGAFVLAKAGLLDGRAATTFPGDQDRFAEMFPDIDLRRGVSFVHDGPALTSEGGAKSFDVAMYLIDHLYGVKVARGVAGGLIIEWPDSSIPRVVVE
ncbi:MAG: DJ-1/PfpI family protein [Planctomycetota bacterium]